MKPRKCFGLISKVASEVGKRLSWTCLVSELGHVKLHANPGSFALFFFSREIIHRCKITLKHYFQFMDIVLALKCANFGTIEPFVTTKCSSGPTFSKSRRRYIKRISRYPTDKKCSCYPLDSDTANQRILSSPFFEQVALVFTPQ